MIDVILGSKSSKNLIRVHEIDKIPRISVILSIFFFYWGILRGKMLRRNVQLAKKFSYIAILKMENFNNFLQKFTSKYFFMAK